MGQSRRANGAGNVYIKHGGYYGRWFVLDGSRTNRKLGAVRRPGAAVGLTRAHAEKRLREEMSYVQVIARHRRATALPDGRDHRAASRRAAWAPMAGPRHRREQGPGSPGVRSRRVQSPKSLRGIRGVPMAPALAQALTQLRLSSPFANNDDLVFADPETGEPLDRSNVRKRFQRACRRAGVRVVRFHDLRHTFGTRIAASARCRFRTLQEWMGHRDSKTTLIYAERQVPNGYQRAGPRPRGERDRDRCRSRGRLGGAHDVRALAELEPGCEVDVHAGSGR